MSRFVSNLSVRAVWRIMLALSLGFWVGVAAIVASCTASPAKAQTVTFGSAGLDVWDIHGGPARYLPDYSTTKPWRNASGWAKATVQHELKDTIAPIVLTAQGQTHQVNGTRVDRLDADVRLSEETGLRVGVLPYRISWCRTYDDNSPWMAEPDAFCRFAGLSEISQGAFGAQTYWSDIAGGWLIDAMAGIYRPTVDGQNDKLGPYVSVGPTVMHKAHGASVNALHLATGIQARAGWLRTRQHQDSSAGSYQRSMAYDSYYLAAEGNVARSVDLRVSLAGYLGSQTNPASPYDWDGRSLTLEAIWKPVHGHSIALGVSRYSNRTTYPKDPNLQNLIVPSTSLAWRFDLPAGWWGVVQATHTGDDYTTRTGANTQRAGTAIGARIARSF